MSKLFFERRCHRQQKLVRLEDGFTDALLYDDDQPLNDKTMVADTSATPADTIVKEPMISPVNTNHDVQSTQPTIKVTRRHDRSTLMWLLQHLIKPFATKLISSDTKYPAGSPQIAPHKSATKRCDIHERKVEDIYLYDLTLKTGSRTERAGGSKDDSKVKRKRIFYYAGGGWQMPANAEHWFFVAELAQQLHQCGYAVTLVSYPLAPNSAAPTSFLAIMRQYRVLMALAEKDDEDVVLVGDSAGGNIVLALVVNALMQDEEDGVERSSAKAVMAISPSTDLRRQNPDMQKLEKKDPILKMEFVVGTARAWCGEWSQEDIRVSPLFADVSVMRKRGIKVHGVTGRYDILSPDAVLFREKCSEAGVEGEWLDWEKQMHVFPLIFRYGLREGREAKDWILDVLRRL